MPTASIYDLHTDTFYQVSAYVVARGGERVATIAFKFPPKGHAERKLWAYVHWLGASMVRGSAGGYGYDKRSAACSSAAHKLDLMEVDASFVDALAHDDGTEWHKALRRAGFEVWQAV